MVEVAVLSVWSKFVWGMLDSLKQLDIGLFKRKITNWENKQVQSGLQIIQEPKAKLDCLHDKLPYLLIILSLWSSIPATLHTNRIIGSVETKGFRTEFEWDTSGKDIYKHVVRDIKPNKNNWIFYIQPSLDMLKNNASSNWIMSFTVEFRHEISKTFKEIKFKIRESDIKRISEL